VNLNPDNIYFHTKLAGQYAMMQRGPDFVAETTKVKALQLRAGAANGAQPK
jgi:hypothetical protein